MSKTHTVTLPDDLEAALAAKLRAGEFNSMAEALQEGVRALLARNDTAEAWLGTEGVARFDAYMANPENSLSPEDLRARLNAHMDRASRP
jgi:antitoxin ParD1/3/4